ncbi:MAG: hypothetical protein ABSA41_15650 [Terriglobia bacterium]|jgi:hypothetical protein
MGRLLEDMTRLSEDIQALRGSRRAFRKELADGDRERKIDVFEMCADLADTQARVAERTKAERLAFLKNLKRTVRGQLRGVRADIAGARQAWSGVAA